MVERRPPNPLAGVRFPYHPHMLQQETTVILFRGRPGVGKTTLTTMLSKRLHSFVLRKDDIYDVTSKYVDDNTVRNKISYNALYKTIESNSVSGATIILDYPFQINENVEAFQTWCKARGVKLILILVICSDRALWKERFNARAENPEPSQLITDFDELEKHYGTLSIAPLEHELVVDTVQPPSEIIDAIISHAS